MEKECDIHVFMLFKRNIYLIESRNLSIILVTGLMNRSRISQNVKNVFSITCLFHTRSQSAGV